MWKKAAVSPIFTTVYFSAIFTTLWQKSRKMNCKTKSQLANRLRNQRICYDYEGIKRVQSSVLVSAFVT